MIDQEKIRKRKVKEQFEWDQFQLLTNLELETGISLKKGDQITFVRNIEVKEIILKNFLRAEAYESIQKRGKEKEFFDITLSSTKGTFEAISSNILYKGAEIVVDHIIYPLYLVETINGVTLDWKQVESEAYERVSNRL